MSRFAQNTKVSPERTRAEIERALTRYGATAFSYAIDGDAAMVGFRAGDGQRERTVRFIIRMPPNDEREFTYTSQGRLRSEWQSIELWKTACRQRWRALLLVLKAKLESVESGIETFDEAFLPHLVMPDGASFRDLAIPAIEQAYATGKVPRSLLGLPEPEPQSEVVDVDLQDG